MKDNSGGSTKKLKFLKRKHLIKDCELRYQKKTNGKKHRKSSAIAKKAEANKGRNK